MFKLAITSRNFKGTKFVAWCPGVGSYLEGQNDGGAHYITTFRDAESAKHFIAQQRGYGNLAQLVPA